MPSVKIDVLSTALCYARYTMGVEELSNYSMKNSLNLSSLANKYFNSSRDENDETIYTYIDPFMRIFVRKSVKGDICNAFNQRYKSEISYDLFNILSKELNNNGNIRDLLEKCFEFLNKYEKQYAKACDSKSDEYRDIDQEKKTDYINKKLNMLSTHKDLSQLDLNKIQTEFDATSLYPSAMWDKFAVYPKIETGYAFQPHKNDVFVNEFNNQTFNQDGNYSAILKI